MKRLRVAMIQDDWWPRTGGGPVHVRELSKALATEYDCEIDVYTRSLTSSDGEPFTETERLAEGAVTVYRQGPCTPYWDAKGRLASLVTPILPVLRGDYDLVHGHTFLPALPTKVSSTVGRIPSVFTVHGTALTSGVGHDTTGLAKVKRAIERQFLLGFGYDHVISVNEEHVPLLEQSQSDVACIPNGVDLDRFDVDEPQVDGRIVFLGRLAPKKRVSDLVRAFDLIATDYPDAELVVVGEGPLEEELRELAADLGVTDRVTFTGRVEEVAIPRYYASAELFVLPSVWEGHPLTLLEAWAASRPVVASDVEGIAEFVDHGETGYLVESRNPDALADAIRYVFDHPEEAREWGENARELAERDFSWKTAACRTRRIYDRVVG
ncbi:MAG: glycosyltransferase family 4 protein [Halapricum sp.]